MRDLERGASTAEMPSFPRRCAQNGEIPAHFILEEGLCDVRGDVLAAWMEDLEMQRQRFKSSGHRGTLPGGAAKAGASPPRMAMARRSSGTGCGLVWTCGWFR